MKKHRKHSRGDKKHGRGRSPRKTNPRRSGQSGTPEQNPVQQNAPVNGPQVGPNHNRTTVVIKHHCSQWEQSVIERQFPHLSFNFVNTRKRHQHIIVNTQRRQGECDAMRMLKPLCSRRNPLLDVGFSMRTRRPWVHGCTRVDTPYEERKFRDVLERHPNNVMNYDDVAIPNRTRWSYCKCDALSCHHVVQPGAAMFIHSIYYNTVDQIAAIINNTVSKEVWQFFTHFGMISVVNSRHLPVAYLELKERIMVSLLKQSTDEKATTLRCLSKETAVNIRILILTGLWKNPMFKHQMEF